MSVQDNIKISLLSGGGYAAGPQKNTPPQYRDRQKQYLGEVTELFNAEYAKYASDYMTGTLEYFGQAGAAVQTDVTFRFANVVRPTAAIQRYFDDYKSVLFDQLSMDYVQPGAKLTTNGSVWLAYNPDNISSVAPNSIFRRCNAVWNHLDFYGNVVSEPIIVEPERANASTPDAQNSQMVSRGYYNVVCQYNDFTRQIDDNTRLVLGSKTYEVTGYGDFSTEFTGDYNSLRLLKFTIRVETKNRETDDMANHIAGGKTFSWNFYTDGPEKLYAGTGTKYYRVITKRNGTLITSTAAHPFQYQFEIDDPELAQITPSGTDGVLITPLQAGTVNLVATLAQNSRYVSDTEIEIEAPHSGVSFVNASPPTALEPFQTVTLEAWKYNSNGSVETGAVINYTASGAQEGSYSMTVSSNKASVTCYGYSETPLTVTAECQGFTDTVTIWLEGY